MPQIARRALLAATLLPLGLPLAAQAQGFPDRTVRLIVPFTPAGQTDIMSRLIALRLQDAWGKPVVVENRPGGNALIGADAVAKAAPDGHTLLAITLTHAVNASLFPQAPYDFQRDLTTLTVLGSLPLVVVVRADAPWRSLAELAAAASAGRLNGGSSGTGSPPHLALELFRRATGAGERLQHVPYRGGAPSVTDLVAGNLDLVISNLPECLPQIQGGRLRALAVTDATRHPLLPTVPTTAEAGLPPAAHHQLDRDPGAIRAARAAGRADRRRHPPGRGRARAGAEGNRAGLHPEPAGCGGITPLRRRRGAALRPARRRGEYPRRIAYAQSRSRCRLP
jgi:tripartite-type tricarboxylate transporter receptor subunit TctC